MQPELFQRFAQLAHEKAGIHIRPGKEALVTARVAKRQRALAIDDPAQYLAYLESDASGQELIQFLEVISTHFTSFFRERDHFDLLRQDFEARLAAGQRRVRIWSCACSTGEEPWSMAMTLLGANGGTAADFKILATDIAAQSLAEARAGVYGEAKVEPVPEQMRARWMRPRPGRGFEMTEAARRRVAFHRLNLSKPPFPMRGPFDAVFCRNILIYFDQPTRQRLISEIERLLRPGGLLCLGHTETLHGIKSGLKLVRPSVFRRAGGEEGQP